MTTFQYVLGQPTGLCILFTSMALLILPLTLRWEGLLNDPLRRDRRWRRKWFAKFGAWFGITPLWRSGMPSKGISLDVRLENGRYVVISN